MSGPGTNDGFAMLKPDIFLLAKGRKKKEAAVADGASEYIQKIPNPDDPEGGKGGKRRRKGGKKGKRHRKKAQNDEQ